MGKLGKGLLVVGLSSLLLLGGCGKKEVWNVASGEESRLVMTYGDKEYGELSLLADIYNLGGNDVLVGALVGEALLGTYEVSDEELKLEREKLVKEMGGESSFKASLKEMGVEQESIERYIKMEIAQKMALRDMNNVTEERIKEEYEKIKVAIDGFYFSSGNKGEIAQVKKMIKEGKRVDEMNDALDSVREVSRELFIEELLLEEFRPLFKKELGDFYEYEDKDGLIHLLYYMEKVERTYDELKEDIESALMYTGIEDRIEVLEFVLGKGKVELQGFYKEKVEELIALHKEENTQKEFEGGSLGE